MIAQRCSRRSVLAVAVLISGDLHANCRCRGYLSEPSHSSRRRLRRRRADRYSGPLHRRQARRCAGPACRGREQAGGGRHRGDARCAGAAARRLHAAAVHAFRRHQCRGLPQCRLSARRHRADLADRQILLRPGAGERDPGGRFRNRSSPTPKPIPAKSPMRRSAPVRRRKSWRASWRSSPASTLNRIPFRGGAGVVQELVAGRVDLYPSPTLAIMSQYQAKQLKILATTSPERLNNLPEVPTLKRRVLISSVSAGSAFAPAPARRSRSSRRSTSISSRSWRRRVIMR